MKPQSKRESNPAYDSGLGSEGKQNEIEEPEEEGADADFFRLYGPVYDVVRSIPPGKVMTYGQVADATIGVSFTARQVGTALRYVPEGVPWQRVVGAGGHLPIAKRSPEAKMLQRRLLAQEGALFHANAPDRVDMARSQWLPEIDIARADGEQGSLFE